MYIPPLFSDDEDEVETSHRTFLLVADVFVGTVVDTDILFCLVWFDISLPLNGDGFPVITEADLNVICLDSVFLAVVLLIDCTDDVTFPGFAVEWSASVFTGFVG